MTTELKQEEVTDSMIREAFLANGFTIKDGHSDLKPYVYAAARAILALRPERVVDVRCEGCGYMTHHREHMGCVRAAKQHTHPAPSVPDVDFDLQELREIERAMDDFADCGETDVVYTLLLRAVQAGFLECTHFHVANRGALQEAIDAAMLAAK